MVCSALTNAGPGLGEFSPERSAQAAGPAGMVVLGLLMLVGRLEFLAVLVLLSWRTWRR
jgi:Trk-type K+ transport system membrane component